MNALALIGLALASAYIGARYAQHIETRRRIRARLQSVVSRAA